MTDVNPETGEAEITVTKLEDIQATRVDGVLTPANGTPFLLIKALAADQGAPDPLTDTATSKDTSPAPEPEKENESKTPEALTPEIVKSMIAEASAEAEKVHKAANDELRAELTKLRETAIPGGPFFTVPGSRKPAKDKVAKAEEYERQASIPDLDRELVAHYISEAKRLRAEAEDA
jgi:hypothetical protein